MTDPTAARGSDANYCSAYPQEPHHMVSHSAGKKVRWVEICSLCRWIDKDALDGWADNAIKESLSARAQRIAVAIETEPFAFVQSSSQVLQIEEILLQALAAAHELGIKQGLHASDGQRLTQIYKAVLAEAKAAVAAAKQVQ